MIEKTELDFIIYCEKRTGSHLLSNLLDNHPEITCQFRELAINNRKIVTPRKGKIKGGIIHYHELDRAMQFIQFKKVIHLVRNMKQVLNSYIATFYTKESIGHYARESILPNKPKLEVDTKLRRKINKELSGRRADSFKKLVEYPTLLVGYGMLSENKDVEEVDNQTTKAILKFLGASEAKLTTRLRKGVSSYGKN
jgi:hypothetical protein